MTASGFRVRVHGLVICYYYFIFFILLLSWTERVPTRVRKSKTNTFDESINPAGIYLLKVNNRSTRARCKICSKLTIKTPKRRQQIIYFRSFQVVSDCFSLLLTLVGSPLIQVWRSFLRNTFNVHTHAENTESKNTLKILQSAEFVTHNIGWGID